VTNHNGAALLDRCLASLNAVRWPAGELEVVVVDNASTDGSALQIRAKHPWVRWIQSDRNLGFAGGNNLALADLDRVDYVALLNNDATVEPGWLVPLVRALEADPGRGAASPKILFAGRFVEVEIETPTFVPGRGDNRRLGVRLSGAGVGGRDCLNEVQFVTGWHGWEECSGDEGRYRWSGATATIRLPYDSDAASARVRLASRRPERVLVKSGHVERAYRVGPTAQWLDLELGGDACDVINSAGGVAISGGYAGDRGFLEADEGQYDSPAAVFSWTGCAVVLRRRYLEEVGLFDARLFLYYEDFDLSWRGRARGWRYVYVPDSVVRHQHAATSVEGSSLFQHQVERNRLLVHAKNAPAWYASYGFLRHVGGTAVYALQDVVSPLLHLRSPKLGRIPQRLTTVLAFLCSLGPFLADRRRVRSFQQVPDEELMKWIVRRASR
jgi:GT2 family glycosyltransferase